MLAVVPIVFCVNIVLGGFDISLSLVKISSLGFVIVSFVNFCLCLSGLVCVGCLGDFSNCAVFTKIEV